MILTIAKPAMGAFARDLEGSMRAIKSIGEATGVSASGTNINANLTLDLGLQVIVRGADLENLGRIEENMKPFEGTPIAMHAPYFYDDPADWVKGDLSRGEQGLETLMRVVELAEKIGAGSIAVHPNAIRTSETLTDPAYTREVRLAYRAAVTDHILSAQSRSRRVSIDLENKPLPTTTSDNERPLYAIVFAPFADLVAHTARGGTMTFDTCHYGISRITLNNLVADAGRAGVTDKFLRAQEFLGYHAADVVTQPTIAHAMSSSELRGAINHIHLNDGSTYRPIKETGGPDKSARLPRGGGAQIFWEGYVPGAGELCGNDAIFPWLQAQQSQNRRVYLTVEVTEFDGNYAGSPRFMDGATSLIGDIREKFSQL